MERFTKFILEEQDLRKVAKVVLINKDDKVLILKRSGRIINEESPWEWDLPGGHIKNKEVQSGTHGIQSGLKREVFEETGLTINKIHPSFKHTTKYFMRKDYETGKQLEKPELSKNFQQGLSGSSSGGFGSATLQ